MKFRHLILPLLLVAALSARGQFYTSGNEANIRQLICLEGGYSWTHSQADFRIVHYEYDWGRQETQYDLQPLEFEIQGSMAYNFRLEISNAFNDLWSLGLNLGIGYRQYGWSALLDGSPFWGNVSQYRITRSSSMIPLTLGCNFYYSPVDKFDILAGFDIEPGVHLDGKYNISEIANGTVTNTTMEVPNDFMGVNPVFGGGLRAGVRYRLTDQLFVTASVEHHGLLYDGNKGEYQVIMGNYDYLTGSQDQFEIAQTIKGITVVRLGIQVDVLNY